MVLTRASEGNAESDGNHLDVSQVELGPKAEDHVLAGPTLWTRGQMEKLCRQLTIHQDTKTTRENITGVVSWKNELTRIIKIGR